MQPLKKYKKKFLLAMSAAVAIFCIGYLYMDRIKIDMNTKIQFPEWNSVSPSQWQVLSQKKVFFAHMSVGNNILDGVRAVLQKHPEISLNAFKTADPAQMHLPALYHTELGHNTKPLLKIESFISLLDRIQTADPDMVLMKFCYVDIRSDTDVDSLFKAYSEAINKLQTQLPNTLFLHCTVPLESTPVSVKRKCKELIQGLLGRPSRTDKNYKRTQFNEMLRNTWPAEQVLDIAKMESITPEGFLCYKSRKGQAVPFLCSSYTSDGGHLNQLGAQYVGQQLLIFLANAAALKN